MKKAGVPVDASVEATLTPTWPDASGRPADQRHHGGKARREFVLQRQAERDKARGLARQRAQRRGERIAGLPVPAPLPIHRRHSAPVRLTPPFSTAARPHRKTPGDTAPATPGFGAPAK